MLNDFGTLENSYYTVDDTSDGTAFTNELLDTSAYDEPKIHYNSFYLPKIDEDSRMTKREK